MHVCACLEGRGDERGARREGMDAPMPGSASLVEKERERESIRAGRWSFPLCGSVHVPAAPGKRKK